MPLQLNNQNDLSEMIESLKQEPTLDEESTKFIKRNLLLNDVINFDIYQAILTLIINDESMPKLIDDDFSTLKPEKIELLIISKMIEFNDYNYDLLKDTYDSKILNVYFEFNISAVLNNNHIGTLTQSQVEYLVSSDNLNHSQKLQLIESNYSKFLESSEKIFKEAVILTKFIEFKNIELLKILLIRTSLEVERSKIVENQIGYLENRFDIIEQLLSLINKSFERLVNTSHPNKEHIENKYDDLMDSLVNMGFLHSPKSPKGKNYKSYSRKKI